MIVVSGQKDELDVKALARKFDGFIKKIPFMPRRQLLDENEPQAQTQRLVGINSMQEFPSIRSQENLEVRNSSIENLP